MNLANRNDEESPSPAGLDDDGDEFGVDGAEGSVPRYAGHSDVVNAVLSFPRLGEDVAELALPDHTSPERHVCGGKNKNRVTLIIRQVELKKEFETKQGLVLDQQIINSNNFDTYC